MARLLSFTSTRGIVQQAEESSTPVIRDADTTLTADLLILGNQITLPTTFKFYKITAVEWHNGDTLSGNAIGGVCMVDADPPIGTELLIVAYTPSTVTTSIDSIQRVSVQSSIILSGGAKLTGFIMTDDATGKYGFDTRASANASKAAFGFSIPPIPLDESIAWGTSTAHMYLKIYFVGYN